MPKMRAGLRVFSRGGAIEQKVPSFTRLKRGSGSVVFGIRRLRFSLLREDFVYMWSGENKQQPQEVSKCFTGKYVERRRK